MRRIMNPIKPDADSIEWGVYNHKMMGMLNDIYLARYLNPAQIRKLCKHAEAQCRRSKDRKAFLMIRKSSDPKGVLDASYPQLMKIIEDVI